MAKKLPNDALLTEILQSASSAKTKAEKIKILQEYNSSGLRALLIIAFDESLKFMLPDGEVPFKRNEAPAGTEHTRLDHEYKGFYRFFKGGDSSLTSMHREKLFIQLLEGLQEDEADKRQLDNLHPEFLDGNGSYVNEELLAVKFMDDDLLLDEEED